jgi:hypothetical protein
MVIAAVVAVVVVALGSADQWAVVPATRDVAPVVLLAATTMVVHPSAAGNYPFLAWCKYCLLFAIGRQRCRPVAP